MGPRKWRISFTTTLFLPLTEIKAEMFPKMSIDLLQLLIQIRYKQDQVNENNGYIRVTATGLYLVPDQYSSLPPRYSRSIVVD